MKHIFLITALLFSTLNFFAQETDIDKILQQDDTNTTTYIKNAFKSTRVINGHSMEMLGKGVLDFRILHRFGLINSGFSNLFGLDQATMRFGFDYGIHKNITVGIGRSTFNKEWDGFFKYRILHQSKGKKNMPFSLLWTSGITVNTTKELNPLLSDFVYRLGYYHQIILGRKFSESFSLQLSPTVVHRNLVETSKDFNNLISIGIGTRLKISKRTAIVLDTYPILYGVNPNVNLFPVSLGVDIETGGHVFQLHISNARGMNEKAFIGETYQDIAKGQIHLGFNLSRVFTVVKNTSSSW